ncbi:MAG: hypothetical protein JW737_06035 [Acidobacteria bacterium]|nr:hypothetical protein [Acidobacteriota bacterium]
MKKIKYHHLYEKYAQKWRKLIDAYEGSGGFENGLYLFRHEKESDSKYTNRRIMAKYFNFAEVIIDTIRDSCLREKPSRGLENHELKEIFSDTDFHGRDIDHFMAEQLTLALIFGFVDTLVDITRDENINLSRLDEKENGTRPYLLSINPLNVVNWEHDSFGLAKILIKETILDNAFVEEHGENNTHEKGTINYRYFDREEWKILSPEGEVMESAPHGLGIVPVTRLYCKKQLLHPFIGQSFLPDPNIFIDYYNLDSEKREIFRQQTFSLLLISLGENSSRDDIQNIILSGTNNALALPYGAKAEFISPDPDQARLLIEEQKQIVQNIFRLKHLKYDTYSQDSKSGEAYKWDYKDLHEILSGLAANLQQHENQIVNIISRWADDPEIAKGFTCQYPSDFNIYSLSDTLETAGSLASLHLNREIDKIYARKVLLPKLFKLTDEEENRIFKSPGE